MKIKNAIKKDIQLDLYPGVRLGGRKFYTNKEFYFEEKFKKDKIYRLMHLYNIKNREFLSEDLDERLNAKMIHWLPVDNTIKIEVLMDNNKITKGLAEKDITKVKEGEIIQAERFGFLKLENKEKMRFIFLHR
jgi:glutamyl-tRNA synthetase